MDEVPLTPPPAPAAHSHRLPLRRLSSLALLLALLGAGPAAALGRSRPLPPAGEAAEVVGITDGDTIKVLLGGGELRVRLFGVDCPEETQPFFSRAKRFTSDLALHRRVRLVPRDWDDRYPDHPRLVAEVVLPDGRDLGRELLREGMAHAFRRYLKGERRIEGEYLALEKEARASGRGLWSDPSPIPPWDFRRGKAAPARP